MSRVDITPDELEAFITILKNLNEDVEKRFDKMDSRLSALGSNWRDQEYTRFYESYRDTFMRQIRALHISAEKYASQLEFNFHSHVPVSQSEFVRILYICL